MEFIYKDNDIVVCVKPARVLSTDEAGGMPQLVREALGEKDADVRTVHRLDRVVSGLMVLARNAESASILGKEIRDGSFHKQYLAVVHGNTPFSGTMKDLLIRDKARRMTFVTDTPQKGAQNAELRYKTIKSIYKKSLVRIELITGRTHQIRCQFASHGFPLVGERKYSTLEDECEIALLSEALSFRHPKSGEMLSFSIQPPDEYPWSDFN